MIRHPIPPLYDSRSTILILGSFPSVKSREMAFFYGHPQNRFWPLVTTLFKEEKVPATIEEKAALLKRNHIALWDSIHECDIIGSSDSSIKNAVPNDISLILAAADIRRIFTNGKKSHEIAHGIGQAKVDEDGQKKSSREVVPPLAGIEEGCLADHQLQRKAQDCQCCYVCHDSLQEIYACRNSFRRRREMGMISSPMVRDSPRIEPTCWRFTTYPVQHT